MSVEMPCIYFSDGKCKKFSEPGYISYCAYAPCGYEKPSNADRIRAMTDEELAKYLDGVCHDLWQMFVKDPQKMWLDWLKEEAKDD